VRERGDEVNELNHFLEAILTSLRGGVVVVDSDRHILVWNPHATDLWGVREDEVLGTDLLTIDIGLPVDELAAPLARVLSGQSESEELTVDSVTRRGRAAQSRVTITSLHQTRARGAILVMEVALADDRYA
jgi:two-component system CheB/CheR fusion protein